MGPATSTNTGASPWAGLLTAATAVGAGTQAWSAYQGGKTQREIDFENARVKEADAAATRARGEWEARRLQLEMRENVAQQKVDVAKGGILAGVGTPLLMQLKTIETMEADAAQIRKNAELVASGEDTEARLLRKKGRYAWKAGLWNAGSSVMTGFGNTYNTGAQTGLWGARSKSSTLYSGEPSSIGGIA